MNSAVINTVVVALPILEKSGPMYYKDLAKILLNGKINGRGKDPVYTVYADLFWNSKSDKPQVKMIGRGVFATIDDPNTDGSIFAPVRTTETRELTPEEIKQQIAKLQDELKRLTVTSK